MIYTIVFFYSLVLTNGTLHSAVFFGCFGLVPVVDNVSFRRRTAAILKISMHAASRYLGIAKKGQELFTPNKSRNRPFKKLNVDKIQMDAIESDIYELHRESEFLMSGSLSVRNKCPSVPKCLKICFSFFLSRKTFHLTIVAGHNQVP